MALITDILEQLKVIEEHFELFEDDGDDFEEHRNRAPEMSQKEFLEHRNRTN